MCGRALYKCNISSQVVDGEQMCARSVLEICTQSIELRDERLPSASEKWKINFVQLFIVKRLVVACVCHFNEFRGMNNLIAAATQQQQQKNVSLLFGERIQKASRAKLMAAYEYFNQSKLIKSYSCAIIPFVPIIMIFILCSRLFFLFLFLCLPQSYSNCGTIVL